MTDNFYVEDLIRSIRKETTLERYLPLAEQSGVLLALMREHRVVFRNDVTDAVLNAVGERCGQDTARLFARFLHLYDFNRQKLREIKQYEGSDAYEPLAGLLRLPGVRLLRAELYFHSGVTLQTLAEQSTEAVQAMVRDYVEREHRSEIVPLTKEVNCHREVAKMILHAGI